MFYGILHTIIYRIHKLASTETSGQIKELVTSCMNGIFT
jgi:hypothetical protein